jgi:hypothetical protein
MSPAGWARPAVRERITQVEDAGIGVMLAAGALASWSRRR